MQPFDSIATRAVAIELDAVLRTARLDKVVPIDRLELALTFRAHGRRTVLVSARGPFSRMHLTARMPPRSPRAGGFCASLRKHLEGARVRRVWQPDLERLLAIEFDARDDLGDPVVRTLVAELTGTHSNLVLLDGALGRAPMIVAVLRPVTDAMSRVRQLLGGLPYEPPPIDTRRQDPLQGDPRSALTRGVPLSRAILAQFHSLSHNAVQQVLRAADLAADRPAGSLDRAEADRLLVAWDAAMLALREGRFEPRRDEGQAWDYELLPSRELGPLGRPVERSEEASRAGLCAGLAGRDAGPTGETPALPPVSALLDAYYTERQEACEIDALRQTLARAIAAGTERVAARAAQHRDTLAAADQAPKFKRWGDLLLTHPQAVPPGAAEVALADPATGEAITVPLDPTRTAAENAQRHYRAYRRSQSARQNSARLAELADREARGWADRATDLAAATGREDLEALASLIPEHSGAARPAADAGPERYRSADGLEILVGRNNRQNDLVTMRLARPDDWWFHAQRVPGSHVVVRAPAAGAGLPDRTCQQAALLAAWFSKARTDTRVPVAYTRRKHVRRRPGAPSGSVTYDHETVMVVQPDATEIAKITRA